MILTLFISSQEIPDFSLVSVPDSELNDAQKKEKKKQRLLKASHDARERMRQEKEAERLKKVCRPPLRNG